mmetsp:Transcript_70898/g.112351  ORF Transcript_70898/g.112351 Transcript_70898/m.112351 type:complete len:227 (-) Transcript_70898:232-912(-)
MLKLGKSNALRLAIALSGPRISAMMLPGRSLTCKLETTTSETPRLLKPSRSERLKRSWLISSKGAAKKSSKSSLSSDFSSAEFGHMFAKVVGFCVNALTASRAAAAANAAALALRCASAALSRAPSRSFNLLSSSYSSFCTLSILMRSCSSAFCFDSRSALIFNSSSSRAFKRASAAARACAASSTFFRAASSAGLTRLPNPGIPDRVLLTVIAAPPASLPSGSKP